MTSRQRVLSDDATTRKTRATTAARDAEEVDCFEGRARARDVIARSA